MYAIISEIDSQSSQNVSKIWRKLYDSCGLEAIYATPTPHFTWLVTGKMDIEKASSKLAELAQNTSLITTYTFGFGIFSGENPILYLPIVKSYEMIYLHEKIWVQMQAFSKDPNLYYSPPKWLPHITLALKDLSRQNIACAVNKIAFEPIELEVSMTSLAIAENETEDIGQIIMRYPVTE